MRSADDILSAHLGNETVLLDLGAKRYYRLNESAAVAYKALEEGLGRDGAIARLLESFEVDPATAADAVDTLIRDLEGRKLVAD